MHSNPAQHRCRSADSGHGRQSPVRPGRLAYLSRCLCRQCGRAADLPTLNGRRPKLFAIARLIGVKTDRWADEEIGCAVLGANGHAAHGAKNATASTITELAKCNLGNSGRNRERRGADREENAEQSPQARLGACGGAAIRRRAGPFRRTPGAASAWRIGGPNWRA